MPQSSSQPTPCPGCGAMLDLPSDADLSQLRCPQCQALLADSSSDTLAPIPPHLQPATPSSKQNSPPSPPPALQISVDDQDRRRIRTGSKGWGNAGLVLSAIGLLALSSAVVATLAIRLLAPDLFAPPAPSDSVDLRVVSGSYEAPTKWIDAATKSLRVGGLKIKVERVARGPVLAKSGGQEILESEGLDLLQIYVSLENQSEDPIDYISWYGNVFQVGKKEVAGQLTDQNGNVFDMVVFEDTTGVFGHVPRAVIHGKETLQDSIVFEIPEAEGAAQGPWRLELPQAAFGFPGSLGFEIPEEMVTKGSRLTPPAQDE